MIQIMLNLSKGTNIFKANPIVIEKFKEQKFII